MGGILQKYFSILIRNKRKLGEDREFPKILDELRKKTFRERNESARDLEEDRDHYYLVQSLYLTYSYLKSNLIADSTFLYGNFAFLNLESLKVNVPEKISF